MTLPLTSSATPGIPAPGGSSAPGRIPGPVPYCAGRSAWAHDPAPMRLFMASWLWVCPVCGEADAAESGSSGSRNQAPATSGSRVRAAAGPGSSEHAWRPPVSCQVPLGEVWFDIPDVVGSTPWPYHSVEGSWYPQEILDRSAGPVVSKSYDEHHDNNGHGNLAGLVPGRRHGPSGDV